MTLAIFQNLSQNWVQVIELFTLPFMQRALFGGILVGSMGGLLGSLTLLRQLAFFSDALGHSALLGMSLGILMGFEPTFILLPVSVLFALVVNFILEKTQLWTDALLNLIYSSALALAIILLSFSQSYKGGLNTLLFGDILAVQSSDLIFSGLLLVVCLSFIGLTLRTQMLLILHEPLAIARGVAVSSHRMSFIVLLAVVVGLSIKTVGALLVSAFVVIPACAARLLSQSFMTYVGLSAFLGALSAVMGIVLSAGLNLPSGPSIVVTQLLVFLGAIALPRIRAISPY